MGDLKWNEFVKSLKATDQSYFSQDIFSTVIHMLTLYLLMHVFLFFYLHLSLISVDHAHRGHFMAAVSFRGTAYLFLPAINLTTIC